MKKLHNSQITDEKLFYQFVGKSIKDFRGEANLNQADLAKFLQLSRTSIVNIEQGRQRPTLFLLWNVAKCLRKDLRDFFPMTPDDSDLSSIDNKVDESIINFIESNNKS